MDLRYRTADTPENMPPPTFTRRNAVGAVFCFEYFFSYLTYKYYDESGSLRDDRCSLDHDTVAEEPSPVSPHRATFPVFP